MNTAHHRLNNAYKIIKQVESRLYNDEDWAKRTTAQEACMVGYLLQARGILKLAMSHWLETKPPKKT